MVKSMATTTKMDKKKERGSKLDSTVTPKQQLTQLTLAPAKMAEATSEPAESNSLILEEIRKLRQEHATAANENKHAMERLETSIKAVGVRTTTLEQRATEVEERASQTEDRVARLERSVTFLLHEEAKWAARCEDLESRARRRNVRIHGKKRRL